MSPSERKEALKALLALSEIYSREVSETSLAFMADALEDIPLDRLLYAVQRYIKDPTSKGFPYPGQLRALAVPTLSLEDDAREASSRILQGVSRYGWNNLEKAKEFIGELGWKVVEKEGGWAAVCAMVNSESATYLKAQWRELAASIWRRSVMGLAETKPVIPSPETKALVNQVLKKMP